MHNIEGQRLRVELQESLLLKWNQAISQLAGERKKTIGVLGGEKTKGVKVRQGGYTFQAMKHKCACTVGVDERAEQWSGAQGWEGN